MSTIASAVFSVDDDNNDADFVPEEQLGDIQDQLGDELLTYHQITDNDEDEIDSDTSPQKRENKTKNEGDMENERAKKEAYVCYMLQSFIILKKFQVLAHLYGPVSSHLSLASIPTPAHPRKIRLV